VYVHTHKHTHTGHTHKPTLDTYVRGYDATDAGAAEAAAESAKKNINK
jgi:hypothetical protein